MASDLARHVRKKYGIIGVPPTEQVIAILQAEGGVFDGDWPFLGELDGVRLGRHVAVRADLDEPQRRVVLLHELAHFLLEAGNQLRLSVNGNLLALQQERRADYVAGWILFGEEVVLAQQLTLEDLAEVGNVTLAFVQRWADITEWEFQRLHSWRVKGTAR